MSRYIDYDAIDYRNDKMHDKSSDFIDGVIYMAQRIEDAPSIDLADYVPKDFHDKTCEAMAKRHTEEVQRLMPKRGEWIPNSPFTGNCSECGADGNLKDTFCSNCGALMREREGER